MKISINPYELQVESFEEQRTVGYAVERSYGEEHELTQHMRKVSRENFDYRNGNFTPETLGPDEASLTLRALWELAKSREHFAPTAAFILQHSEVYADSLERFEITEPVPAFQDPPVRTK